jgi:DNA-binding LacI/PurR family transcriptional regulator
MAVNQKQIAEKLGVSIALVSRVLSGKAAEIGITADTINRVLRAAEEMGYVPSAAALSLKGKSTRTIGVAVYDFNDPFFGALIKQIQIQAHGHNYSLILAGFINRTPDEQDLQPLYKHALDGLIVIGTDLNAEWLCRFQGLPVARIGHGGPDEQSVRVTVDEDQAARLIIDHLIAAGRTRLVYLCANLPAHRIRQQAFERAAADGGIALHAEQFPGRDTFEAGQQLAPLHRSAAALICATDQVAMGALHALNDTNIAVPGELAVTGFDDIPAAAQFIPTITTIRQPIEQIVEQAFAAVTDATEPKEILLPGKLIARETA